MEFVTVLTETMDCGTGQATPGWCAEKHWTRILVQLLPQVRRSPLLPSIPQPHHESCHVRGLLRNDCLASLLRQGSLPSPLPEMPPV